VARQAHDASGVQALAAAVVAEFEVYLPGALAMEAKLPGVVDMVDTGLEEAAVLDLDHSVHSRSFDLN